MILPRQEHYRSHKQVINTINNFLCHFLTNYDIISFGQIVTTRVFTYRKYWELVGHIMYAHNTEKLGSGRLESERLGKQIAKRRLGSGVEY